MDKKNNSWDIQTRSIHSDKHLKNSKNALNPPIYQTSTFTFQTIEDAKKVMNFESDDYIYTRGNNPTLRRLEKVVCSLENAKAAVTFSSGMAAISSVLLSLLKPNDQILVHKTIYGSAYSFINNFFKRYKIEVRFIDLKNEELLKKTISEKTKVIYFETPANPTLEIIDIKKIVKSAKKYNSKVVIDNTFATPYFQNPLDLGADIVIHSATKYLNGHGDVVAGIALSNDAEYMQKLKFQYMCDLGSVLGPFEAWLILRGLKTFAIRMREHQKNAMELAEYLKNHNLVKKVYYPGLNNFPDYGIAISQMRGFGGIVGVEFNLSKSKVYKFVENLRLCKIAVSLGDAETLVEFPSAMTHFMLSDEELKKSGISPTFVRVSLGLEKSDDIINDFSQALSKIK